MNCKPWWLYGALLLSAAAAVADIHPETLRPFVLDGSPLLRGFVKAGNKANAFAGMIKWPPVGTSTLLTDYFHGPTELRCSVLLFPTRQALDEFVRQEPNMYQNGFSAAKYSRIPVRGVGLLNSGGVATAMVNRVLIEIWGFQHREAARRDPQEAGKQLSDAQLDQLLVSVRDELARRARQFPANR